MIFILFIPAVPYVPYVPLIYINRVEVDGPTSEIQVPEGSSLMSIDLGTGERGTKGNIIAVLTRGGVDSRKALRP
jgi:hypothetical protein